MKNFAQKHANFRKGAVLLAGILLLVAGLVLIAQVDPAAASPVGQDGYPIETPFETVTPTVTVTITGTLSTPTLTPTATITGTLGTPTVTPTQTRTPQVIPPVTGGEQALPTGETNIGVWVAVWLLGLLLVVTGLRARPRSQ